MVGVMGGQDGFFGAYAGVPLGDHRSYWWRI